MSVTSISRDTQNNVSIVRMISTNNIATITSANYILNQMANIRALNSGFWQWYKTDFIACSASDGNDFLIFTDSTFSTVKVYESAGTGTVTSITAGTGLSGGTITTTGTIALAAINTHTILSNITGGSAIPVGNTISAILDLIGSTQGDILYRSATGWNVLAPGSLGQFLQTQGPAANPIWTTGVIGTWIDETSASTTMLTNSGYTADDGASLVTFTLPTTSAIGDFIEINGKGSGLFTIAQASGQQINFGNVSTTLGATGSLSSTLQYDNVRLRCLTANTIWTVVSVVGNLTVV